MRFCAKGRNYKSCQKLLEIVTQLCYNMYVDKRRTSHKKK